MIIIIIRARYNFLSVFCWLEEMTWGIQGLYSLVCVDTGCCQDDLLRAVADRNGCRGRVNAYVHQFCVDTECRLDDLLRAMADRDRCRGRVNANIHQFCVDTGCSLEDLPRAMADRVQWRERVKGFVLSAWLDDDDDHHHHQSEV